MKILLAGPTLTSALSDATGYDLSGLPRATAQTPIAPIAAGLIAQGHIVHVVTLDPHIDAVESHVCGPLTITFCPLRAAPRYRARVRSLDLFEEEIKHLSKVMAASDADIVHAHWTYEYAEAAIRSGRPMIATMHDVGWDCFWIMRDTYRFVRLVMKYRSMLRIPALTAVAPFMARKTWQYGYFKKTEIIPNPILDAPFFAKSPDRNIIVTIGSNGRIKNVAASVLAFKKIRERLPSAELHLFGPGLDNNGLFGNITNVICHGNVAHYDLMKFLEDKACLCIHPSRIECCPVILGEAKIRGVPIVTGIRSGGTSFVCGDVGRLVDINDIDDIADAAIDILTDKENYLLLQVASRKDIEERFSLDSVTSAYISAYEKVIDS